MWIKFSDSEKEVYCESKIPVFVDYRRSAWWKIILVSVLLGALFSIGLAFPTRVRPNRSIPSVERIIQLLSIACLIGGVIGTVVWVVYYMDYKRKPKKDKIDMIMNKCFSNQGKICVECQRFYNDGSINCPKCGKQLDDAKHYLWFD